MIVFASTETIILLFTGIFYTGLPGVNNNNRLMFDPQDWGEAHAIALGHAFGVKALLTDDTKKSGPRDYILKGVIEAIDTIAFWEVLILLSITDCLEAKMVNKIFNQVKQDGYTNLPKKEFHRVIFESLNRLKESNWFRETIRSRKSQDGWDESRKIRKLK
jgi:hypothetical protein